MDERGELPSSARDEHGWFHYERAEVEALAKRRRFGTEVITGDLSATVFEMFDRDLPMSTVVRETKKLPSTIRLIRADYERGYQLEDPEKVREREARERREELVRKERELEREREDRRELNAEIQAIVEAATTTRPSVAKATTVADPTKSVADRVLSRSREILRRYGEGSGRGGAGDGDGRA